MGRASNRKKARRQSGHSPRRRRGSSRPGAATHQVMGQLAAALEVLSQEAAERQDREAAACRVWCGGSEPVPADVPLWPDGSLGDRFVAGTYLEEALAAPCLLTAEIPPAAVIAADSGHWNVAASALVRAVVFDGLTVDHLVVSRLLDVLTPIAVAELAYREAIEDWLDRGGTECGDGEPDFPELDGPVFLLGGCALVDATWAAVGEDPLSEVLGALLPVLDRAVPGLEGRVVANALIGAFATHYRCEQPGDAEVLERIQRPGGGDALENLVTAGAVPAKDILPVGLRVLSALAGLCRSDAASLLARTA